MMRRAPIVAGLALMLLGLPGASYAGPPGQPAGADAWFYETAERVTFNTDDGVVFRDAVSPLTGFAPVGTPLCPSAGLANVPGDLKGFACTVIAVGKDAVNAQTEQGPVSGTFYVVVDIPQNPSIHVPNFPMLGGTFKGKISPAFGGLGLTFNLPLLSVEGSFTIRTVGDPALAGLVGERVPFTGTFRIPIGDVELCAAAHVPVPPCPVNPEHAFYLVGNSPLTLSPVALQVSERAIGFSTVRLEVQFGQPVPGGGGRDDDDRDHGRDRD